MFLFLLIFLLLLLTHVVMCQSFLFEKLPCLSWITQIKRHSLRLSSNRIRRGSVFDWAPLRPSGHSPPEQTLTWMCIVVLAWRLIVVCAF